LLHGRRYETTNDNPHGHIHAANFALCWGILSAFPAIQQGWNDAIGWGPYARLGHLVIRRDPNLDEGILEQQLKFTMKNRFR